MAPALAPALSRWDWSIDLGILAVDTGLPGALDTLRARVLQQRRRHGALARALWAAGQPRAALDLLTGLDPKGETFAADQETRVELALMLPDAGAARAALVTVLPLLPPGPAARLRLMTLWLTEGAAALAAVADGPLPAHPAPWAYLWHVWLAERDLPRAAVALSHLGQLRAPSDPETALDHIRLALEQEDPEIAQALLSALPAIPLPATLLPATDQPAHWSQRRHALHLRALLALGDLRGDTGLWMAARAHGQRAARLYPRNTVLTGLALAARERLDDWTELAGELAAQVPDAATQATLATFATLARLGLPDPGALTPPAAPDMAAEARRLQADLHLQTGNLTAALALTDISAQPSPTAAALAEWRAEALLWQRQPRAALDLLDATLARHPARLGLILQRARARFFLGDFAGAEAALADFRTRKQAQTGLPPAEDLRDRITADALTSHHPLPEGESATASAARLGPALAAHPGLAACWLARPGAVPQFHPDPTARIPHHLTLYWEGAMPRPVSRGIRAWEGALKGWALQVHDRASARDWLASHDPEGRAAFDQLHGPAARADLFRACLIAAKGGVYVDSDEYPRGDVTPWLTGARAVLVLESGYGTVANNFLAALPGLPLFADLRARVLARVRASQAEGHPPYPWWDTGPAQLSGALAAHLGATPAPAGLRVLSQAQYCTQVSTNLPFPHKRGPGHWRQGVSRPGPPDAG